MQFQTTDTRRVKYSKRLSDASVDALTIDAMEGLTTYQIQIYCDFIHAHFQQSFTRACVTSTTTQSTHGRSSLSRRQQILRNVYRSEFKNFFSVGNSSQYCHGFFYAEITIHGNVSLLWIDFWTKNCLNRTKFHQSDAHFWNLVEKYGEIDYEIFQIIEFFILLMKFD